MNNNNNDKQIKVEHVVKSFRIGGLEKIIKYLILDSGDTIMPSVSILQRSGPFSDEVEKEGYRVTLFNANERKISSTRLLWEMTRFFRRNRPDVIHCHDTESWVIGAIAGRLGGVKNILFTKHGHMENINWKLITESKLASWLSKKIVAVSPQVKQEFTEKLQFDPEKIEIIYNGIDNIKFHPSYNKIESKKKIGISDNSFTAGTVTRFFQIKNIEMQIDMVERIKDIIPEIQYIIVAPMTQKGKIIQENVIKRGLQEHIRFLGFRSDIPEVLRAMDVFVLSSFSEGTSVALLEAMASGCVPVASATGGTPNIIKNAENGFLFDVNDMNTFCDNIIKCYKDKMLQKRISKQSTLSVKKYSKEKMVINYNNIYYNLTKI